MMAMSNMYEWCGEGVTSQIDNQQHLDLGIFSWLVLQLQQDRTVQIADVAQLPDDAVDFQPALGGTKHQLGRGCSGHDQRAAFRFFGFG